MSPYVHPSPDIDQYPQAIRRATPESRSPSTSTILSSDTINTAPSGLSSEILNASLSSSRSNLVSPSESTNTKRSQTTKLGPFTQHRRFFFEDGNITFVVDGVLYRVHRYFFCRDSKVFMTRLARLPAQEGSSLPVISLQDIKSKDFDAFLSVLYPLNFNALEGHSSEELSSILELSTRWGFTNIRDMAIRCMEPPTAHERLVLARKYNVDEWIPLALQGLCERPQPLTSDEARLMDFEDVILVGCVREKVRNTALKVDSAGMRDCIEALRRGEPWPIPPASAPAPASPIPSSTFGAASGFDGFGRIRGGR